MAEGDTSPPYPILYAHILTIITALILSRRIPNMLSCRVRLQIPVIFGRAKPFCVA